MELKTIKHSWSIKLTLPFYKVLKWLFPKSCKPSSDPFITPFASAMPRKFNWLYRIIFPRFFAKIRYELPPDVDLTQHAQEGTLVYIGTRIRELEYIYFSHLLEKIHLPPSMYANRISLRRWMAWHNLCATLVSQFETTIQYGGIPHPAKSGELEEMIYADNSVLFSLAGTELQEESAMFSESHQLILSAIKAQGRRKKPIYLVPLNFIWDRRPRKAERSIIDILFGEKDDPGTLRKIILFWRNYKSRAVVQIGNPIDLKAYAMELPNASEEELALHIRKRIIEAINAERRSIVGPVVRSQRWFIERVMADPDLEQKLSLIAVERSKTLEQLTALARRYAKEIASNLSYTMIELVNHPMGWVFRNLFEDISVDTNNLSRLKELSAYTPLIFVPNHRSHIDYLMLSYIFYNNNMIVPHIASGINLAFWPLGAIFRRCGAYFIRRTFAGNPVYKIVLQTYLSVLLQEGYNQEFFIEGGRSRTGKLRPPRMGMISMLTDSVMTQAAPDLIFVPVAITYDRVIEQKSYTTELKGESKQAERTRDVFGLTKFLRKQKERNGTIYIRFGEPVSLSGAAHELSVDLPMPPENKRPVVSMLADQICHQINRHMVITPLSIAALALLLKPKRAVTTEELHARVAAYLDYVAAKTIETSESLAHDPAGATKDAIGYLINANMVRFHDDPEFPFYEVLEESRIVLEYFKNSSVHYFASLAFLCTLLEEKRKTDMKCRVEAMTIEFGFLQTLFQFEFRFNQQVPLEDRIKPLLRYLEKRNALTVHDDGYIEFKEDALHVFDLYAGLVRNVIDAYIGALTVLARNADEVLGEKELIKKMLETGPKLFLTGQLSRREAVSKENFTHAMAAFRELEIITVEETEDPAKKTKGVKIDSIKVQVLKEQLEQII